ncbi:HaeIII family restriction endonuclease [Flavobacterium alkalisoli]|uniref:HaeIII family restriction endonuclease n=1 Tax=Flavobacterium alkalisoli TaxID=2602769 RepID=UPI003A907476
MAKQVETGKAFEYALLNAFYERLSILTKVEIVISQPYVNARDCFDKFNNVEQDKYRLNASAAVNFLIDIEPRLSNDINDQDILQLEIVSDKEGQSGDVRDVLAIRSLQKWEIGVSAKNNHKAVKHSRLSNSINFGQKWLGITCSQEYFNEIKPIFDYLDGLKKQSKSTKKWSSLGDYPTTIYLPVLIAFKKEIERMVLEHGNIVAEKLVQYLIGNKDFYKVIKGKNSVEIQAYNIQGSLNQSFNNIRPKGKINRLKLPTRLIEIVFAEDKINTLIISLNEGWQISFRIHNASSRIEPSLKFDINLISSPSTLFTNHILHTS